MKARHVKRPKQLTGDSARVLAAIVVGYVSPEGYTLFLSVSFLVGFAVTG